MGHAKFSKNIYRRGNGVLLATVEDLLICGDPLAIPSNFGEGTPWNSKFRNISQLVFAYDNSGSLHGFGNGNRNGNVIVLCSSPSIQVIFGENRLEF